MRKLFVVALAAGLMAVAAPAFADGPAGTSEGTGGNQNNVDCGAPGTSVAGVDTGAGIEVRVDGDAQTGGAVVVCNDDTPANGAPIQGRVIASGSTSGGYLAVDGDRDNPSQGQGWARVDVSDGGPIVRCGGAKGGGYDAANPIAGASQASCLP